MYLLKNHFHPTLLAASAWALILVILLSQAQLSLAASQVEAIAPLENTLNDPVLCQPRIYLVDPEECLVSGPASYLTELAKQGILLPLQPLPASPPDPSLVSHPFFYARLKGYINVPLFATMEDALEEVNPVKFIEAGELRYVSYIQEVIVRKDRTKPDVFLLKSGEWVAARDVAQRENAVSHFQGLTFRETPRRPFGWVLPIYATTPTKRTPGYAQNDFNTHQLTEYQVVQIYASQQVGDTLWYLIGPDEWVEQRFIGKVTPNPIPPEGVTNGRWIEVNLFEQTLAVYDNHKLVFATLVASGLEPFFTRPGLFPIYKKLESTPMRGAFEADRSDFYYLEDVPWTLYYDQARALHGAYWRTRFGIPQSHGCVNLSTGDAHWLFNWAQEGDWVYIWDPSGKTPTDPRAYGEGGA